MRWGDRPTWGLSDMSNRGSTRDRPVVVHLHRVTQTAWICRDKGHAAKDALGGFSLFVRPIPFVIVCDSCRATTAGCLSHWVRPYFIPTVCLSLPQYRTSRLGTLARLSGCLASGSPLPAPSGFRVSSSRPRSYPQAYKRDGH